MKTLIIFCFLVFLVFFVVRRDFLFHVHSQIKSKNNKFNNIAFLLNMFNFFIYPVLFLKIVSKNWLMIDRSYHIPFLLIGTLIFMITAIFLIYLSDKNKEETIMKIVNIIFVVLIPLMVFMFLGGI